MAEKKVLTGSVDGSGKGKHEIFGPNDTVVDPLGNPIGGGTWITPSCHDDLLDKASSDTGPAPWLIIEGSSHKLERTPNGTIMEMNYNSGFSDLYPNGIGLPTNRNSYIKPSELLFFDVEVTLELLKAEELPLDLKYGALIGMWTNADFARTINGPEPHTHSSTYPQLKFGAYIRPNEGSPSLQIASMDFIYVHPQISVGSPLKLAPDGLHKIDLSSLALTEIRVRVRHELAWIGVPRGKWVHRYVFAYWNPVSEIWVHAFTFFRMGGGYGEHGSTPEIPYYNMPEAAVASFEPFTNPLLLLSIVGEVYGSPASAGKCLFKDLRWVDAATPDTEDLPDWVG